MTDRPSDLKPCPFCGGPATVYRAIYHPSAFVAECASLDEEGSDGWFCAVRPKIISDRGKEAAIERWNARATPSTPVLFGDVCIADATELRDMAAYLDSLGKKESSKFLRSVADRHEVLAGAYQTSTTRYERELKEWIERDRTPEEKAAAKKWLADLRDSVTPNTK